MHRDTLKRALEYLDSFLRFRHEHEHVPGFSVAVGCGDRIVFDRQYGFANLEKREALTPGHLFRVASHAKMFTATAIMRLVQEDKLQLRDCASRYVPALRKARDTRLRRVTIEQLLSHGSGMLRDGNESSYWQLGRSFPSKTEISRELARTRLTFGPLSSMKYSNYGYSLLGTIIETVTGVSYREYVRRAILGPLRLSDSGSDFDESILDRLVTGYTRRDFGRDPLPVDKTIDTHGMSAATGFYSTAKDLCRFMFAHCYGNERILSDLSKRELHRAQWRITKATEVEEYGPGFCITYCNNRKLVGHGGGFPGQLTQTRCDPESGLVVSVLTNSLTGMPGMMCAGIFELLNFFETNYRPKAARSTGKRFDGRFMSLWNTVDIVALDRDRLVSTNPLMGWRPFLTVDHLEKLDKNSLRVSDAGSYGSNGELVRYSFSRSKSPVSLRFAGHPYLSEANYRQKTADLREVSLKRARTKR